MGREHVRGAVLGGVAGVLALGTGCAYGPVLQTVETSVVATQVSAAPSPMAPLGVGERLERGESSLLGGGSVVGSRPLAAGAEPQVVPLTALGRVATALDDDGLELVLSGGASPTGAGFASLGLPGSTLTGVVGRGAVGLRVFVPFEGTAVEWSWSVDVGAVSGAYRRIDTVTVTTTDAWGTTSEVWVDRRPQAHHVVPDARLGTVVSAPIPGLARPVRVLGGLQLQSWPVFWASAEEGTTCTTWAYAGTACEDWGGIPDHPARVEAVFTPALGTSVDLGELRVHGLLLAHVGPEQLGAAPFGATVAVERRL